MPSGGMHSQLGLATPQSGGGLQSRYHLLSHRSFGGRTGGELRHSRSLAAPRVRSAADDAVDPRGGEAGGVGGAGCLRRAADLPMRVCRRGAEVMPFSAGDSDAEDLFSELATSKPGDLFAWVEQQAADVEKKSMMETLEAEQARSVGLHLRGKAVVREGLANEDDPARHFWHRCATREGGRRWLHSAASSCTVERPAKHTRRASAVALLSTTLAAAPVCRKLALLAQQGDYIEAEAVMDDMARSGFLPGPRAYHALIFSHVKGDNAAGALAAIRTEFTAGGWLRDCTAAVCLLLFIRGLAEGSQGALRQVAPSLFPSAPS